MGNRCAVVGDGDGLVTGALQAVFHFPFIQGTAAAVDDQAVLSQVIRELRPACKFKEEFLPGMLSDPAGQLYSSDIFTLTVVGAAFGDR